MDILDRITKYAGELLDKTRQLDHDWFHKGEDVLGPELFHLVFSDNRVDVGYGDVAPQNEGEWARVREETDFDKYLTDAMKDRLSLDMYVNPVQGFHNAVAAALAEVVADRALELDAEARA